MTQGGLMMLCVPLRDAWLLQYFLWIPDWLIICLSACLYARLFVVCGMWGCVLEGSESGLRNPIQPYRLSGSFLPQL